MGVPPLWAALLSHRGINQPDQLAPFLRAGQDLLLDPFRLPDMEAAVTRLQRAIQAHERVGIFGDFDADGVTATALLHQAFTQAGLQVIPYIPHRVTEGHGLNPAAVDALQAQGVTLLVTVDCGVSSPLEVERAKECGMDTIITDHHVPPAHLPRAMAIVNPRVPGATYPFLHLTGAGLAFKLAQGLARASGHPWDPSLLELAAIGTIGDLAPLVGENRFLVRAGIERLRRTDRPGLRALYQRAGLDPSRLDAEALAFAISPRLNAVGRLEHAQASLRLLTTPSVEEGEELALQLEEVNRRRQRLTAEQTEQALRAAETQQDEPLLVVESEGFSPGIVGLVASRLVEEHWRPAVVIALQEDIGMGSARSTPWFNMAKALAQCEGLLERYGGHAQAAGFVARRELLPALREQLRQQARTELAGAGVTPTLDIDAEVPTPRDCVGETYTFLRSLGPFGVGNPPPTFLTRHLEVAEARLVGNQEQHLMLKLRDGQAVWDAIAFQRGEQWQPGARRVDVVYTLNSDARGPGEGVRLRVVDFSIS